MTRDTSVLRLWVREITSTMPSFLVTQFFRSRVGGQTFASLTACLCTHVAVGPTGEHMTLIYNTRLCAGGAGCTFELLVYIHYNPSKWYRKKSPFKIHDRSQGFRG